MGWGSIILPSVVENKTLRKAQDLRRNSTEGEKRFWKKLREFRKQFGIHVRRQVPIGPYVADFAIHDEKLVIEVDGEFHFTAEGREADRRRDEWLNSKGYRVLRFNTGELAENLSGCVEHVLHELGLMH